MADPLQAMVDELADELGRSVVIDDPVITPLCASRHFGDEDQVRVRAMLQRTAGSEVIRFVLDQGVARWAGAGMLAGSVALGLAPRLCVPLRGPERLLGFLMVIDEQHTLTPAEIATITDRCAAVAVQLDSDRRTADPDLAHTASAVHDLLGPVTGVHPPAQEVLLRGGVRDGAHAVVTVVEVGPAAGAQAEAALRAALRPHAPRARSATAVDRDRGVLLQLRDHPQVTGELRAQARSIVDALDGVLDPGSAPVIGVGGDVAGMAQAWTSHRDALAAVRAARRIPALARVGLWADLAEYAVLLRLPDEALTPALVPEPLRVLVRHAGTVRLVETLRCFLDNAGSIPRTAADLHLHRTSLYYRLRRIRELTGLDLDDGHHRLVLHTGLRVLDLGVPTE